MYLLRSVFLVFDGDAVNGGMKVLICKRSVYRFVDRRNIGARERTALGALRFAGQWRSRRHVNRASGRVRGMGRVRRWLDIVKAVVEIGAMHSLLNLRFVSVA